MDWQCYWKTVSICLCHCLWLQLRRRSSVHFNHVDCLIRSIKCLCVVINLLHYFVENIKKGKVTVVTLSAGEIKTKVVRFYRFQTICMCLVKGLTHLNTWDMYQVMAFRLFQIWHWFPTIHTFSGSIMASGQLSPNTFVELSYKYKCELDFSFMLREWSSICLSCHAWMELDKSKN